ncbi:uncharacterized protein K489DRAFT_34488 [Dissoconium aciculare CBS 342.82]|uniref:Uncharacterized protein n=1 Tax=Dissoconium aciculare CBS 342.82 TaxID=1314786 RepID=A0A6J3LXM9_9PEZI|nr:uncharacterized protein K489DRAFT_34488 [Dissoconium aciculare CBS 342.82]KAF1820506.1 hypothetical protein K489DRAFT_34488 [Dissoconium aciculare CBS 342.82]
MRFTAAAVIGFSAVAVQGAYAPPAPVEYPTTTEAAPVPVYTTSSAAEHPKPTADKYTTEVVTAYTTYCPEATQITHGGVTYSVTSATTLTIPAATVTKAVYTPASAYHPSNGTKTTGTASGPTSYTSPSPQAAKGDAAKLSFGFAGLIAAFGLVAAL